jgi:hypothetical protein
MARWVCCARVSPSLRIGRSLRPWISLILSGALVLAAAGCGGSSSSSSSATATSSSSPSSSTTTASTSAPAPRPRRPRPRGAPVGAALRVHAGTSTLLVTVAKVLDPLTGSGSALLPGHRATGVQVSIRGVAGATYDSTASGDWSILTTAGLASPLFVKQGICETPLADFESLIGVGQSRAGCVAFSVPRHARILSVRFSPHSRARGAVAWR